MKKFSKLLAVGLASTMVFSFASAADYSAFMMYADSNWANGVWTADDTDNVKANNSVTISDDGTYTVGAEFITDAERDNQFGYDGAQGAVVWCVDIEGLASAIADRDADYAAGYDALTKDATAADKQALVEAAGVTVSNVNIIVDGEVYAENVDVYYGDIEANGTLRIEIRNDYGTITSGYEDLVATNSLEVQFTIAGVNGPVEAADTDSTDASDDTDASADTDAAADTNASTDSDSSSAAATTDSSATTGDATNVLALAGLAVVALGGVVIASKKRA
jgi:LPXTG-motif cell wall-anchored protein